jgi:hypothetical protein
MASVCATLRAAPLINAIHNIELALSDKELDLDYKYSSAGYDNGHRRAAVTAIAVFFLCD